MCRPPTAPHAGNSQTLGAWAHEIASDGGAFLVPRWLRRRIDERLRRPGAVKLMYFMADRIYGWRKHFVKLSQREILYGFMLKNGSYIPGYGGAKGFKTFRLDLLECTDAGLLHVLKYGRGRDACTIFGIVGQHKKELDQRDYAEIGALLKSHGQRPALRIASSDPLKVGQQKRRKAPSALKRAAHQEAQTQPAHAHMQPPAPATLDDSPLAVLLAPICEQWGDTNVADTLRYAREQGAGLDNAVLLDAAQKAIAHVEGARKAQRAENPMGLLRYRIAHETVNARKEQEAREALQAERERQWAALLATPLSEKARRCEALLREQDWPGLVIPGMRLFSGEDDWQWLLHCNQDEALLDELLALLAPDLPVSSPDTLPTIHQAEELTPPREEAPAPIIELPRPAPAEPEARAPLDTEPECLAPFQVIRPALHLPKRPTEPRYWLDAEALGFPCIEYMADDDTWQKIGGMEAWHRFKEHSSRNEQDSAHAALRQLRRPRKSRLLLPIASIIPGGG